MATLVFWSFYCCIACLSLWLWQNISVRPCQENLWGISSDSSATALARWWWNATNFWSSWGSKNACGGLFVILKSCYKVSHDTLVFWVEKDIRGCIYYRSFSLPFQQMLRCPFIFQISLLVEQLKLLEIHMFLAANILVHSAMCLWQNLSDKNTIEGPIGCVFENLLLLYPAVHTMIPKILCLSFNMANGF